MLSKSLVAIFLALPAAIAVTGVLALLGPGSLQERTLPVLMMFVPIWVTTICVAFLFRNGMRAALCLSMVAGGGFALIHFAHTLHWVTLPS